MTYANVGEGAEGKHEEAERTFSVHTRERNTLRAQKSRLERTCSRTAPTCHDRALGSSRGDVCIRSVSSQTVAEKHSCHGPCRNEGARVHELTLNDRSPARQLSQPTSPMIS